MFCPQCGTGLTYNHGLYSCYNIQFLNTPHYTKLSYYNGCTEQLIIVPYLIKLLSNNTVQIYSLNQLIAKSDDIESCFGWQSHPESVIKMDSFDMSNEFTPEFIENLMMLS